MAYPLGEVIDVMVERLRDLAAFTDHRAESTGRSDFLEHAAMYRRDAAALSRIGRPAG